ncbi:hypothetical protein GGS23DRAFT_574126 [Durotheca rogersii]|uniref:uncharacterized protein n=1 Tax=Durotheca rogersii TaxID=419775 RepID=UPI00221FFCDA|nr:uncharacterized protein GGS23DRAFT_574126 [Durotheca rogersii]KAI5862006.1 hypothetical protein GGS23DRAFT_574126 [Durotheca rogersii]
MLFPESDASLLRAWIINRLANTSDADADVLADYVLALLRHDGDVESIRKMFEDEIPDFLREDASSFTDDVFQAVKFRSYLPGAPPAPPIVRQTVPPPSMPTATSVPSSEYKPRLPFGPAAMASPIGQGASRKRAFHDRDDGDVDIILNGRGPVTGPQSYKQLRRGGGYSQRGGRFDDPYGPRAQRGYPNPYQMPSGPSNFGPLPPLPFEPSQHGQNMPPIDANSILENMQRLQQLGIPIPDVPNLPKPVYSGFAPPSSRRRKQRCRDYDTKGYCSRGSNCMFEHGSESLFVPSLGALGNGEYDPNNAALTMPLLINQPQAQTFQPPNPSPFHGAPPANRREPNKTKRGKGRVAFAANGPVHDKTKSTIVVQNIPSENFSEDQVREYFSQFGKIREIAMQASDSLAILKFGSWDAAHAAWSSPKVIFDNRFVKVFWYKDEDSEASSAPLNGKAKSDAKNGAANGNAPANGNAESFDMDEFIRKQEEAQKIHDERTQKRQEIERQRRELEEREKELLARRLEEKRKLQAKLVNKGPKDGSPSTTGAQASEGAGEKPSSQTEALRAQLAALEEEANVLGIDPNAAQEDASWNARGRGRGGRVFRGRYAPRAFRGSYGYRGRGGGVEARHAAYAVYSLDNRPKVIVLTGVDFTIPEKDEALRQYLFGFGEFKDIHTDPAATHITFKERKTAEQFMFGVSANNTIPGLDDKLEIAWANSTPQIDSKAAPDSDAPMTDATEEDSGAKDRASAQESSATAGLEEGEVENDRGRDQGDMDYEAGEDWGLS